MKVVILAAGLGTRLRPLTNTKPKALIEISGKTIIEHIMNEFADSGNMEFGIVVGHRADAIKDALGKEFRENSIEYFNQDKINGTANALYCAKDFVDNDSFIVTFADTLIIDNLSTVINTMKEKNRTCVVVSEVEESRALRSGVVEINDGKIVKIMEKPENVISNIVCSGLYYFKHSIFETIEQMEFDGEMGIPDVINRIAKNEVIEPISVEDFVDIGTFEGLNQFKNILKMKND